MYQEWLYDMSCQCSMGNVGNRSRIKVLPLLKNYTRREKKCQDLGQL